MNNTAYTGNSLNQEQLSKVLEALITSQCFIEDALERNEYKEKYVSDALERVTKAAELIKSQIL